MATFTFLSIILVVFFIIETGNNNVEGQRGGAFYPRIQKIISRPDSDDLDDYDINLPPSPLARLPLVPPPMPLIHSPFLGGIGTPLGINPLTRLFPNPYQHQNPYFGGFGNHMLPQRRQEIYTAIGYDKMDPSSQMRLTITERKPQGAGMMNPIIGGPLFPGMGFDDDFHINYDAPTNWYIQGAFLSTQLRNKAGTYQLVLTESGRTADGCVGESLGRIVTSAPLHHPFFQSQNSAPAGVVANPVLVGTSGPTVYASTLEGISRRQLVGAGLAACQYINNGVCGGYIPFCATVSKDLLPAMEVPLATKQAPTTMTFNPFDDFDYGLQDDGMVSFGGEDDRRVSFNPQQALARQGQPTGPSNSIGLLF